MYRTHTHNIDHSCYFIIEALIWHNTITLFHCAVYVFTCRSPSCHATPNYNPFAVVRQQLPEENCFYPIDDTHSGSEEELEDGEPAQNGKEDKDDEDGDDDDNDKEAIFQYQWEVPQELLRCDGYTLQERESPLCVVCGIKGSKKCSRCQSMFYCSKQHQSLDWKTGHSAECSQIAARFASTREKKGEEEATTSWKKKNKLNTGINEKKKHKQKKPRMDRTYTVQPPRRSQGILFKQMEIVTDDEPEPNEDSAEQQKENEKLLRLYERKSRQYKGERFEEKDFKPDKPVPDKVCQCVVYAMAWCITSTFFRSFCVLPSPLEVEIKMNSLLLSYYCVSYILKGVIILFLLSSVFQS